MVAGPEHLQREACSHSEPSEITEVNRDFASVHNDVGLYLLCRGLNDDASGEFAANAAGDTILSHIVPHAGDLSRVPTTAEGYANLARWLLAALERASSHLHQLGAREAFPRGLAASCMCMLFYGDKVITAHVGNTRAYLVRGGKAYQLGEDHSQVSAAAKTDILAAQDPDAITYGGLMTRSLGARDRVKVDTNAYAVLPGDTFLLCTDGIYRNIPTTRDIAAVLAVPELDVIAPALIAAARRNGSEDCATGVVVRVRPEEVQITREELEQSAEAPPAAAHGVMGSGATQLSDMRESAAPGSQQIQTRRIPVTGQDGDMLAIEKVKIFQDLGHQQMILLSEHLVKRIFHQGASIIREGDRSNSLFVIVSGKTKLTRNGATVTRLLTGQHFGEMALVSQRPRSATVLAISQVRCLELTLDNFNKLATKDADLVFKIVFKLAQAMALRLENELDKRLPLAD